MKKNFSTHWKESKQPRKQKKYLAKAPLHLKRKLLSVNLSKDLRKKYSRRNILLRKGDLVKITRGKFNKKQGKIIKTETKTGKIFIEGIQIKKIDGSKIDIPIKASNIQIIELNLDDKERNKKLKNKDTKEEINKKQEKK
jgi:large subunit ribosomal protein L24